MDGWVYFPWPRYFPNNATASRLSANRFISSISSHLSVRHIDDFGLHRTFHLSPNSCTVFRRMDYSSDTDPVSSIARQVGGRRRRRERRPRSGKPRPGRQQHRSPGVPAVVLRSSAGRGEDVQFRGRDAPRGPEAEHLREVGVSCSCPHFSRALPCQSAMPRPAPIPSHQARGQHLLHLLVPGQPGRRLRRLWPRHDGDHQRRALLRLRTVGVGRARLRLPPDPHGEQRSDGDDQGQPVLRGVKGSRDDRFPIGRRDYHCHGTGQDHLL